MSTKVKPRVVFLDGQHVYLRPLELADADPFRSWLNDPSVRINLKLFTPLTERAEQEFIEKAGSNPDDFVFAIVRKQGDRLIGATGLHRTRWKDRATSFGIFIGDAECRGCGYGAEATRLMLHYAFESLNLNRVELGVYDFNEAAIHLYEQVGFVREGSQREHSFVEGRYVNHHIYSMLGREYFAVRSGFSSTTPASRPRPRTRKQNHV